MSLILSSCAVATEGGKEAGNPPRRNARLPQVDPAAIAPGSVIELEDGEYEEALILPFKGSAEKPVVIKAATGARPTFHQPVLLAGAAYLRLEGITVVGAESPGITISQGSHHITVSGCTVERCGLGIWITDGAGAGHRLERNTIRDSKTHGIAVDRINAEEGVETVIIGNRISGNGQHGVELNGSWYVIEENEVFDNGAAAPGTSGIHVFAKNEGEDAGDHNVIRYNVTYRNREHDGPDGNGIQLDQWCDHNTVYYNIAFENDGAGICLFDASQSSVLNNTLFGNCRKPNRNRPYEAELLLAGDARVNRTREVVVANNIAVATAKEELPLLVDQSTAGNALSIHHNLLFHSGGGDLFSWAGQTGTDLAALAKFSAGKVHDNLAANPEFVAGTPSRPADFRLRRKSAAGGGGSPAVRPGNRDILGTGLPGTKPLDLGAVQSTP